MLKILKSVVCCVFVVIFLIMNLTGCNNFFNFGSNDVAQSDEPLGMEKKGGPYSTFFYNQLSDREKKCYKEMLSIFQKRQEKAKISLNDVKAIEKVFYSLIQDHPEIFYVSGYSLQQGNETYLSGAYMYDENEIASRQNKIDRYVSECLSKMPSNSDDYEKVKYIYEYLVRNTEYQSLPPDDQNICSVFVDRKSVCTGYSKATQYLLNCLGINTILVTGFASVGAESGNNSGEPASENHAWNEVCLDGNWYCVDTTWGGGFSNNNVLQNGEKVINYDHLLCTTKEFNILHKVKDGLNVPVCTHIENNYFVREGAYFEKPDLNKFVKLVNSRLKQKKHSISIKCASIGVYNELKRILFEEGGIRNYISKGDGSGLYTSHSDELLTLSVFF